MDKNTDISKIIGLIMENPDIIERIKSLAGSDVSTVASVEAAAPPKEENAAEERTEESVPTYKPTARHDKKRRSELLCALKPYLSESRSKAIDTMLNIIEVIDLMKVR